MRFLIQRVTSASVEVDSKIIGQINQGFLVFIGICHEDTQETADIMIKKLLGMRIFADSEGKTNLSLESVNGSLLLVSQFTLYADCKKGNRPSFTTAGEPTLANELYEYIIASCKKNLLGSGTVSQGSFGADMKIALTNDGPFTIILDSDQLTK